jgi:26S proteasome regulatory subunit T1
LQTARSGDIQILKTYGQGPYAKQLKKTETDLKEIQKRINEKMGACKRVYVRLQAIELAQA